MTLWAYRDGILAADGLSTSEGLRDPFPYLKCARRQDGAIMACAGSGATARAWLRWFLRPVGRKDEKHPGWEKERDSIVILTGDGRMLSYNDRDVPDSAPAKIMASGWWSYLMGMMHAGLSSLDAVRLGCQHYTGAGFPIAIVDHKTPLSELEAWDGREFVSLAGAFGDQALTQIKDVTEGLRDDLV